MSSWSQITNQKIKKQKLNNYINKVNESIASLDGHITVEKNLILFEKFRDTLLNLEESDIRMKNGEIVSINGVRILNNHLLYIDGIQNPRLNIVNDNKMDSFYSFKSFVNY